MGVGKEGGKLEVIKVEDEIVYMDTDFTTQQLAHDCFDFCIALLTLSSLCY
jgi:hypothetical protein